MDINHVYHNIPPVYDTKTRILILGSFPSVKSREGEFFYHHPQNRFWRVISSVLGVPVPETVENKRSMLIENGIALWDVVKSCDIIGSSDAAISNVCVNDFSGMLSSCDIKCIYANGKKAYTLYNRMLADKLNREIVYLPSTSPANAACDIVRLVSEWQVIKDYLF